MVLSEYNRDHGIGLLLSLLQHDSALGLWILSKQLVGFLDHPTGCQPHLQHALGDLSSGSIR